MNKLFLVAATSAALFAGSANAASVIDNFDRADAPTLGSNWAQQAGSMGISGNAAVSTGGQWVESFATFNGVSGNSISFDVSNNGTTTQYVGGALGVGNGDNIFVKVQNNGAGNGASTGLGFDRFGFYINNDDNSIGRFGFLTSVFTGGNVTVSLEGSIATLIIKPTDGLVQTYVYDYGFTPTGKGVGLGIMGNAAADNFAVAGVPEPQNWAMMIVGFGLMGGALRRRRNVAASFA